MRFYDVAVTSLAIDAPIKWTDNVLSQHDVPGVAAARRGVARRIPHPTLLHLALTRELHAVLGLSVRDALPLDRELLDGDGAAIIQRGAVHLALDRALLERAVERRLREALESAPTPRRGPPTRYRSRAK
ncbi:MAG: hypothetical protein HOQ30_12295 [Gemmatimonadaceae bacterium]|nr:hypothetical protein [Gemmatimonadaceae bacterium]